MADANAQTPAGTREPSALHRRPARQGPRPAAATATRTLAAAPPAATAGVRKASTRSGGDLRRGGPGYIKGVRDVSGLGGRSIGVRNRRGRAADGSGECRPPSRAGVIRPGHARAGFSSEGGGGKEGVAGTRPGAAEQLGPWQGV
jgi:hypothetical protein